MRIISGEFRGFPLHAPSGLSVRPTPARVREALFSMLGGSMEGFVFADLFAGAGTVGLEAVSRGAREVLFVESSVAALRSLDENIRRLGCADRCRVLRRSVESLAGDELRQASVIFLDPPYRSHPSLPKLSEHLQKTDRSPVIVYQHGVGDLPPPGPFVSGEQDFWRPGWLPAPWRGVEERKYGKSILDFYVREETDQ